MESIKIESIICFILLGLLLFVLYMGFTHENDSTFYRLCIERNYIHCLNSKYPDDYCLDTATKYCDLTKALSSRR